MILITFTFTDSCWYFKCEEGEFTFYTIEDAEKFVEDNSLGLTLRGCLI